MIIPPPPGWIPDADGKMHPPFTPHHCFCCCGKDEFIKELRNDPEVISAIRRGLEARRNGERIHWDDVRAELGI